MSDRKGLTITLTIIAVLLGIASVLTLVLSDSKGPNIAVDKIELTYVQGGDKDSLLEGVSAFDNNDGDVSNSLMVKDISILNSGDVAKVTYAARDKHNNISEAYRLVKYINSEDNYSYVEEEITVDEVETEESTDEIENIEEVQDVEETEQMEEEIVEELDEVPTEPEQKEEPRKTNKKEEQKKDEDKTPKITLKQKTVNINVGQTFNPSDYIITKENVSNVAIDGGINVMVPGTYPLTFNVTGTDGSKITETLTVVVK